LVDTAARAAAKIVGAKEVQRFNSVEWGDQVAEPSTAIVLLAEGMAQNGALNLAATTLDALLVAEPRLRIRERGRIMARRARIEWMRGSLDAATDRYRSLERLGRTAGEPELIVRALVGRVAVAQMKGNYPEMLRYARRAAKRSDREGFHRLSRQARNGLMIAASIGGRFDEALRHGWLVYEASIGNAIDEAEILQNLGQVLALAGHYAPACAAFAAVATRNVPARIMLPALGSLALASAESGRNTVARWAAGEVARCQSMAVPRYALASALFESGMALARLGMRQAAESLRLAALRLAKDHNFHEILVRAEEPFAATPGPEAVVARSLSRTGAGIARRVGRLEPLELPRHVGLEVGTS